jgi:hypothetical protein
MAVTYKLIEAKTLSSAVASITFTSIPSTYTDLQLLISSKASENGQSTNYWIQFNSDTGANYTNKRLYSGGASAASDNGNTSLNGISAGFVPGSITSTTDTFSNCAIYIPNYAGNTNKSTSCDSISESKDTTGLYTNLTAGLWSNTSAITSLTIAITGSGQTQQINSSFYLYGIKKD